MPAGEIIAIGTELLLGEIQDTNTALLARIFRDHGIDLFRATLIGDNVERIAGVIREALDRSQIIITSGGLGPTVDDPTRLAVARAVGAELEFRPELWDQIQDRFRRYNRQPTENNRRQAFIPRGAQVIENPVGTAPAFYFLVDDRIIVSLPGVPRELETIFHQSVIPLLRDMFLLEDVIKAYVLHAAGVGESQVDEWIGDLETQTNPTVGLLAHPGIIDIRITAKAHSVEEADHMIAMTSMEIQRRVGIPIYGTNEQTLEEVLLARLKNHNWRLTLIECGFTGSLTERLVKHQFPKENATILTEFCEQSELAGQADDQKQKTGFEVVVAAGFYPGPVQQSLSLYLITPNGTYDASRSYGGPPALGIPWAANTTLDFIRRNIP